MRVSAIFLALLSLGACGTDRWGGGIGYGSRPSTSPSAYAHYLRGRLAIENADHDRAIDELRMATAAAPDEAELALSLAEELHAAGHAEAANAAAEALVRRWPEESTAWRLLGRIRAVSGDVAGAATAFEASVALADDETAYLMLGAAYRQLHDEARAAEVYRRLVTVLPGSAEGHHRLGRMLLGREPLRAEAELRRAVELDPAHLDARIALAEVYRRQGRASAAEESLRAAYDRSGADAQVGERLYHVLLETGDRAAALRLLHDLDRDGRALPVRLRLGVLLLQLHQANDALRLARTLIAHDPVEPAARLLAARALAQLGQRSEAIALCLDVPAGTASLGPARALAAELHGREGTPQVGLKIVEEARARLPNAPELITAEAALHEQLGALDRARAVLDLALTKAPNDESLVYARATLEDRAAEPEQAVVIMRRLLDHRPDSVVAMHFIGGSYANRGVALDDGERLLRRATALRPDDGFVLDSLGWLFAQRGRLEQARTTLERADRIAPFEPEIMLHLGEVYLRGGESGRARETFRQALALDPTGKLRLLLEERVRTLEAKIP